MQSEERAILRLNPRALAKRGGMAYNTNTYMNERKMYTIHDAG